MVLSATFKHYEPEVENVARGSCDQRAARQAGYLGLVYEGL